MSLNAVKGAYARSALTALAISFAASAIVLRRSPHLRNANAVASAAFAITGLALKQLKEVPRSDTIDQELVTSRSSGQTDYTIVIPVYNRPDLLRTILLTLKKQAAQWGHLGVGEIIVVDDGSNDDTSQIASKLSSTMPISTKLVSIKHAGPGAARNAGFAAGTGRIGVSIDSDCLPTEGWLEHLLFEVGRDPTNIAFAEIVTPAPIAYPIENVPDRKGFVSASFAIDREAFCKLGGFHTGYGMSHEDIDFVEKARQKGFHILRARSQVMHPIRHETLASIWKVGLNSRFGNLFASRHPAISGRLTRTTPYYLFGYRGHYGSSLLFIVFTANALLGAVLLLNPAFRRDEAVFAGQRLVIAVLLYLSALALIGLRVGAGVRRLPIYVATLATFQVATFFGRLKGTAEYGVMIL